jgi:hypothetical protein
MHHFSDLFVQLWHVGGYVDGEDLVLNMLSLRPTHATNRTLGNLRG